MMICLKCQHVREREGKDFEPYTVYFCKALNVVIEPQYQEPFCPYFEGKKEGESMNKVMLELKKENARLKAEIEKLKAEKSTEKPKAHLPAEYPIKDKNAIVKDN